MEGMVNDMTAPNMTETMGAFELPTLGWRDDDPLLLPFDAVRATELAMYEGMSAEEFMIEHWRWTNPTERRLTSEQASDLKRLYRTGRYSAYNLATMFGISHGAVMQIARGETYRDVA